jgi:hypothetical protein
MVARWRGARGRRILVWGYRARRVVRDSVVGGDGGGDSVGDGEEKGKGKGVEMKSGPKVCALRPRPWRRMRVLRWGGVRGGMVRAGGKKPGGSGAIFSGLVLWLVLLLRDTGGRCVGGCPRCGFEDKK